MSIRRMLGQAGKRDLTCNCCDHSREKKAQRAHEKREWQRLEALHELT